ncbi:MAG TPA: bifunctional folylpolyglutamate synthase/dihydrofolate synthase [Clostridiaceae bacterium]|nr:bifunctional folylpolyglutamate synthase/dihydrofolate synthase [Clostridiaceae bacterium]
MGMNVWKKRYKSRNGEGIYWSLEKSLEYLAEARKFGIRPGLARIEQLLERLGNPQNACPVIHIAGTNGKGSISSMCAYIAANSGLRTGLFTSPYLTNFNERIRIIDGHEGIQNLYKDARSSEISDEDFAKTLMLIAYEVEIMSVRGFDRPTEFEMITAAAFVYFAEMRCDLVVLETGMGGRLDSTNVVEEPLATIISALSYDHTGRLGSTISKIAAEKAGIMRPNVPVFVYNPYDTELTESDAAIVKQTLSEHAKNVNAPLSIVNRSDIEYQSSYLTGQTFTYKSAGPFHLQLSGDYQAQNAALAIEACRLIIKDENLIQSGISLAKWAGRLECISQAPFILIDGAHNKQGVYGLRQHLEKFLKGHKLVILAGVLHDKDYKAMLDIICSSELYDIAEIICTSPDFPRALKAKNLAVEFAKHYNQKNSRTKFREESQNKFLEKSDIDSRDNFYDQLPNKSQLKTQNKPRDKYQIKEITELESKEIPLYNENRIWFTSDRKAATEFAYGLACKKRLPLVMFGSLYLLGEVRPYLLDLLEGLDN